MTIKFLKVHLHHFLSFDDSTIDLSDKGYCLVIGVNKNPKDAAKSNGSGKSTIWNAISYALVGETLSGLKTNLANNYYEDGCYVELDFQVDNNKYKLIRSKDDSTYGTNLKIYIDGEDKSGKGIRESQALLDQYLPDLTSELLGSVIILGQGLPQKFTANSPSGRKEVLEHLSKSDFMIQDLKDRIETRLGVLNTKSREIDDILLSTTSKKTIYLEQLEENKNTLSELLKKSDFDELIAHKEAKYTELESKIKQLAYENAERMDQRTILSGELFNKVNLKRQEVDKLTADYQEANNEIQDALRDLNSLARELTKDITTMKNIKDVCPTCGQKIPGVVKPDTSAKEEQLSAIQDELLKLKDQEYSNNAKYLDKKSELEKKHDESIDATNKELKELEEVIKSATLEISNITNEFHIVYGELISLKGEKESYDSKVKEVKDKIKELNKLLVELDTTEATARNDSSVVAAHIKAVNKMNTLVKREFRGILLSGIIDFINAKAKEYASKIFNSDNLEFVLDGNNIDIIFEGKDYENLSGGEKQRVDLIVQFAIRDMMSQYLNFSSNILVLDEITDALDSISCDKVVNFITEELKDVESVFIISHHADELELPQDSQLVVEKNVLGLSEVK